MIFDSVDNLYKYKGIYHNLDIAIDYVLSNNILQMDVGRYDISGNDIYMNVTQNNLQKESDCIFEVHQKYLDLHIEIDGREKIKFASYCDDGSIVREYDEMNDYALLKAIGNASCDLDNKHFAICMLGEPHMPCLKLDDDTYVKKAVLKILVKE